jgi:hypothetical protein
MIQAPPTATAGSVGGLNALDGTGAFTTGVMSAPSFLTQSQLAQFQPSFTQPSDMQMMGRSMVGAFSQQQQQQHLQQQFQQPSVFDRNNAESLLAAMNMGPPQPNMDSLYNPHFQQQSRESDPMASNYMHTGFAPTQQLSQFGSSNIQQWMSEQQQHQQHLQQNQEQQQQQQQQFRALDMLTAGFNDNIPQPMFQQPLPQPPLQHIDRSFLYQNEPQRRRRSSMGSQRSLSPFGDHRHESYGGLMQMSEPIIEEHEEPRKDKKKRAKTFPEKLMQALIEHGVEDAVAWLPDGKSFVVVNPDAFVANVLSPVFKQAKYASFVRKLHRWGFVRLTSGTGTDCFHHPLFNRNRREWASKISCVAAAGGKESKPPRIEKPPSLAGVERFIKAKTTGTSSSSSISKSQDFPLSQGTPAKGKNAPSMLSTYLGVDYAPEVQKVIDRGINETKEEIVNEAKASEDSTPEHHASHLESV